MNNERYASILKTAMEGFCLLDAQGRILEANDTLCRMYGYSREELLTMAHRDLEVAEGPEEMAEHTRRIVAAGADRFETRQRRKDGRIIDVEVSVAYVGKPRAQFVCFVRDVTESKRAQEAVLRSELRFRSLFENALDGVILAVPRGVVLAANPAACRMFGMTQEELCRAGREGLIDSTDPRHAASVQEWRQTGQIRMTEARFIRKNGEVFPAEAYSVPLEGDPPGAFVILRDISERKRAEERLCDSEERSRRQLAEIEAIYDSARIGLCVLDRELRYVRINRRLAALNEVPPEEHIGKTVEQVVPSVASMVRETAERVFRTGEAVEDVELTGVTVVGTQGVRTFLEQWYPLKDAAGQVVGVNVVVEDVTERKRAEEALRESERRLAELSANLADGMVYQVNTGVNGEKREFTYVSPAVERLHGFSPEALRQDGSLLYAQIIEEDRRRVAAVEEECLAAKRKLEEDLRVRLPSGQVRWRRFISSPRPGPDGTWLWDCIELDITEAKQAQESLRLAKEQLEDRVRERTAELADTIRALRQEMAQRVRAQEELAENREELRSVLVSMDDLLFVLDTQGRFLHYYQPPDPGHLYVPPEEFLGRGYREVMPPEVAGKVAAAIEALQATGQTQDLEYALDMPGGRRWYSAKCSPQMNAKGEMAGITVVARDTTQRVLAQQQLQASEARFRGLFEDSPVAMWEMDYSGVREYLAGLKGQGVSDLRRHFRKHPEAADALLARTRVLEVNEAALRMHGAGSREELLGVYGGRVPGSREHMVEARIALFEGTNPVQVQTRAATLDGRELDVIVDYLVLPGHEGQLDRAVVAITDVTGIQEAQAALRQAHRQLLHATEAEQKRIAREMHDSVAQDAVALHLLLGKAHSEFGEPRVDTRDALRTAFLQCGRIVKDLRGICHGLYPQALEMFGLPGALRQLGEGCANAGLKAEVVVGTEVARKRFPMDVEIAVYRIAQEATSNALKHSKATNVTIHLYSDPDNGTLGLAVTDNGRGFRGGVGTPTGLGLVSMRERASAVGGSVRIDSRTGGGTTVFLDIPVDLEA